MEILHNSIDLALDPFTKLQVGLNGPLHPGTCLGGLQLPQTTESTLT